MAYKTQVKLEVFDSESKLIKKLVDEEREAGTYEVEFDARSLPKGIYIYQLQEGDFLSTKKMLKV